MLWRITFLLFILLLLGVPVFAQELEQVQEAEKTGKGELEVSLEYEAGNFSLMGYKADVKGYSLNMDIFPPFLHKKFLSPVQGSPLPVFTRKRTPHKSRPLLGTVSMNFASF